MERSRDFDAHAAWFLSISGLLYTNGLFSINTIVLSAKAPDNTQLFLYKDKK